MPVWKKMLFTRTAWYIMFAAQYRKQTGPDRDDSQKVELERRDSMTHALMTVIGDMNLSKQFWDWFKTAPKDLDTLAWDLS